MQFKGREINPAHVVQAYESSQRTGNAGIYRHREVMALSNGETIQNEFEAHGSGYGCITSRLSNALARVVPAASGFDVLQFYGEPEEGDPGYSKLLIVAWSIDEHNVAQPVCLETVYHDYAILHPDGHVLEPEGARYSSVAAWRDAMSAEQKAKAETQRQTLASKEEVAATS